MRGYLLDTNHVGALARQEAKVLTRLDTIPPENLPRVCTITLGEIEAGNLLTKTTNQVKRDEFLAFVYEEFYPYAIEITATTGRYYAEIMGRIFQNNAKPTSMETERYLVNLGVDINDVWTAAVAFEHGLIFVTDDNMACIRQALGTDVVFDNWL